MRLVQRVLGGLHVSLEVGLTDYLRRVLRLGGRLVYNAVRVRSLIGGKLCDLDSCPCLVALADELRGRRIEPFRGLFANLQEVGVVAHLQEFGDRLFILLYSLQELCGGIEVDRFEE